MIDNAKYKEVKNWKPFQDALVSFLKDYECNNASKIDWLVNAQYTESKSESILFNSICKKNDVIDLNSLIHDPNYQASKIIFDSNLTKIRHSSKILSSSSSLTRSEIKDLRMSKSIDLNNTLILQQSPPLSPIEIKQNDISVSSIGQFSLDPQQSKIRTNSMSMKILLDKIENHRPNAKKELINYLKKHLCESSNHVIWEIIAIFKESFKKQYKHYLALTNKEELIKRYELILQELCNVIRTMKKIIKKFLRYLYKNRIEQLVGHLENRDLDVDIILNTVTYQLIFNDADGESTHYRLIYELLRIKYEKNVNDYLEVVNKLKENKIQSYDDSLKDVFWLENIDRPYDPVITLMKNLHGSLLNPFHKFEVISAFQEEIAKYLEVIYQNQNEKIEYLIMKLKEPDSQYPIINYCLVQSMNENLVLDLYFVKEFINEKFRESRPQFIAFEGCLVDYIISGEILEKVKNIT